MKKLLTLSTIALVALTMGIGAKAAPQETKAALERTVQRDTHRIRVLQNRRAYLHRYIRHLRKTTVPTPHVAPAASYATQTAPSAPYTGGVLSASQVAAYARAAGFPESVIGEMVAIAYRESNFCPTAVYGYGCSGSGHAYTGGPACGLWELYPCPGAAYLNPATNAAGAYAKYQASGLAPWAATS